MIRCVEKSGISPEAQATGVAGSNPATATNLYQKIKKNYRPWQTLEEIPKFALIRDRGHAYDPRYPMFLSRNEREHGEIRAHFKNKYGILSMCFWGAYDGGRKDMNFWHMVHSVDGGKTWQTCGVKL